MSFTDLALLPPHLLAASIVFGKKRLPVRVIALGPDALIFDSADVAALAVREGARVVIACPLSSESFEVTAKGLRRHGDRTWLTVAA
jgi:hypothetical protein